MLYPEGRYGNKWENEAYDWLENLKGEIKINNEDGEANRYLYKILEIWFDQLIDSVKKVENNIEYIKWMMKLEKLAKYLDSVNPGRLWLEKICKLSRAELTAIDMGILADVKTVAVEGGRLAGEHNYRNIFLGRNTPDEVVTALEKLKKYFPD